MKQSRGAGICSLASLIAPAAFAAIFLSFAATSFAQNGPSVSVVVTAEPKDHNSVASLTADQVKVVENGKTRPVTSVDPLGADSKIQLLVMIDDSAGSYFGTELPDLKKWINGLPPSIETSVSYMRNGTTQVVHDFSAHHAAVANSIRLPLASAGADVSPYDSLTDAIKKWPETNARREVVMISSGIEALGGGVPPENPYVNAGISAAQKAGVVVYTIYFPSAGHWGHTYWRETIGQSFLSQLSDETGGESYINSFSAPVSIAPFLNDILGNLRHQYVLTFTAEPAKRSGFQQVRISSTSKTTDLAAPDKVYVKASL